MEEALRTLIVSDTAIAALVGQEVHWGLSPQSVAADFINMSVISGPRDYHMQGDSGLGMTRIQCDCWASKYSSAKLVARALVAAVSGFSGDVSGITFQGIFIDAERDDFESRTGDIATRFRTIIDIIVWHA